MTNRNELIEILEKEFPGCYFKEGEFFSSTHKSTIWSGEGSIIDDMEMLNTHSLSEEYIMGVHKKMVDFLDEHGWYHQTHDSGTVFFYPNE